MNVCLKASAIFVIAFVMTSKIAHCAESMDDPAIEFEICKIFAANNQEEEMRCAASAQRALMQKREISEASREFLSKFGIAEPDAQAKLIVANRKGLLFIRLFEECKAKEVLAPNAKRFRVCLDQHEKAEKMLGNELDKPDSRHLEFYKEPVEPAESFLSVLQMVEAIKRRSSRINDGEQGAALNSKQDIASHPGKKYSSSTQPLNETFQSQLSYDELELVHRQIAECWNLPAGAKDSDNLNIDILVIMNPNGTVREARVVNQERMRHDPFFRASAESALRAVLNPRCSPLKFPPEKYMEWKVITLSFNPQRLFN